MSHHTDDPVFVNHKKIWDKIINISENKKLPIDDMFLFSELCSMFSSKKILEREV
jgi:hypothetical protein